MKTLFSSDPSMMEVLTDRQAGTVLTNKPELTCNLRIYKQLGMFFIDYRPAKCPPPVKLIDSSAHSTSHPCLCSRYQILVGLTSS